METVANVASAIIKIGLKIKQTVEQIRHNANQFQLLSERTTALLSFLRGHSHVTLALTSLQRTQAVLAEIACVAEEYTQRSILSRLIRKGGDTERIADLTKRLNEAIFDLNAGLNMQQVFDARRDKEALEEDLRAIECLIEAHGAQYEAHLTNQDALLRAIQRQLGALALTRTALPTDPADCPVIAPSALQYDPACRDPNLGSASFGIIKAMVYSGTPVAVKFLNADNLCDDLVDGLRRELQLMRHLMHPNVVRALGGHFDVDDPERTFIVMERHVVSLRGLLARVRRSKQQRLTEREILMLGVDACRGLAFLQERGIVHRDLHSGNLLLGKSFVLQVTDFGLGKAVQAHEYLGTLAGAPVCAAPEVLLGRYSFPADVWSFGLLLAEMCLGRLPQPALATDGLAEFDEQLVAQAGLQAHAMRAALGRREACLACVREAFPALAERVVQPALEVNPHRRATMAQLLAVLEELLAARSHCAAPSREAFVFENMGFLPSPEQVAARRPRSIPPPLRTPPPLPKTAPPPRAPPPRLGPAQATRPTTRPTAHATRPTTRPTAHATRPPARGALCDAECGAEATLWCAKCEAPLCAACWDAVHKPRSLRSHVKHPLSCPCDNECGAEATVWCPKCEASLCAACWEIIHKPRALRNHVKRPLTERTSPANGEATAPVPSCMWEQ